MHLNVFIILSYRHLLEALWRCAPGAQGSLTYCCLSLQIVEESEHNINIITEISRLMICYPTRPVRIIMLLN